MISEFLSNNSHISSLHGLFIPFHSAVKQDRRNRATEPGWVVARDHEAPEAATELKS
jgi:hypothetical protein